MTGDGDRYNPASGPASAGSGGVAERTKATVSKTVGPDLPVPWVRIPPPPLPGPPFGEATVPGGVAERTKATVLKTVEA